MQVKKTTDSDNQVTFSVIATEQELQGLKEHVLGHFQQHTKVPGFREGKVPTAVLEKHVDQNTLQTEFLQEAVEQMYSQAANELKLKPLGQPQISIKKFVPFTALEFDAEVPVVGEVKLADYKNIKKTKPTIDVTADDVKDVLSSLKVRLAEKQDVDRASATGDQIWIDFAGTDTKGKPVPGADGKDYPLLLGSNTFIPGFEDNLVGARAGEEKTFTLTFPKDYGVKALANKKVSFKVDVTKVQEVIDPKLDDEFATKAGPFQTLAELKADIKKQLSHERQHEADRQYESELVKEIAYKSTLSVPKSLVDEQIDRLEQEERQNLTYRGQTWQEHLEEEGVSEDEHREQKREAAEERAKMSLVLSEIAEVEKIDVTPEELEIRMQILKGQYQDPQMQSELNKPEARRDIASRILTEKTLNILVKYAAGKS